MEPRLLLLLLAVSYILSSLPTHFRLSVVVCLYLCPSICLFVCTNIVSLRILRLPLLLLLYRCFYANVVKKAQQVS